MDRPTAPSPSLAREILRYVTRRKKYWLVPLLLALGIYALVIFLSQAVPVVSPFIYVLF